MEILQKKHLKVEEPENDNSSSEEEDGGFTITQTKITLNSKKRKAMKEKFSSGDEDGVDAGANDEDDDEVDSDEERKPVKAGMKRSAAGDEKLKKASKKPKLAATTVVKQEPMASAFEKSKNKDKTHEKPKSKANINQKPKLAATTVEKQKVEKSSKTLFVRVPPKNTPDPVKIQRFFAVRGIENSVRPLKDRNFVFVELVDEGLVGKALLLSGERMDGLELRVERANEPPALSAGDLKHAKKEAAKLRALELKREKAEVADRVKLFVKNLPGDVTEELLKEHFPKATSIRLPRSVDKSLKGFAFVEFENESVAEKVLAKKQGSAIGDKTITLDFVGKKSLNAKPSKEIITDDPTRTLFVKQLPFQTTAEGVKKAFSSCTSVRLATFPDTGKSRGYAFVTYDTAAQAESARVGMDGSVLEGRTIVVGFARTPEENAKHKKKNKKGKQSNKVKDSDKPQNGALSVSKTEDGKENDKPKVKKPKKKKAVNGTEEPAKDLVKLKKNKEEKTKSVKVKKEKKSSGEPLKKRVKV